jgi:hypothetical protein
MLRRKLALKTNDSLMIAKDPDNFIVASIIEVPKLYLEISQRSFIRSDS